MHLTPVGLLAAGLLMNVSCAAPDTEQRQTVPLPAGLSYAILDSIGGGRVRLRLDVLLSEKQSETVLRDLAVSLRNAGRTHYQYFTVTYTVPGVANGHWATVDLVPTSDTRILGLTADEELRLIAEPIPSSREIIGRWINDSVLGGLLTIFRERGRVLLEQRFTDRGALRGVLRIELKERPSRVGRRFDRLESDVGDHWLINADGVLEIRDTDGLIAIARRVN
jgi:hypothetical protein